MAVEATSVLWGKSVVWGKSGAPDAGMAVLTGD
jgi:hypothetical protein